jgi:hypothetical protein
MCRRRRPTLWHLGGACILSHRLLNVLIGLWKFPLARTLQEHGRVKNTRIAAMNVHPAITAATLVLLALAFVGALTATGVFS